MRQRPAFSSLIIALSVCACSTTHEFRVAAVGDAEQADAEATSPAAESAIIAASGNVILGPASRLSAGQGSVAAGGTADGTVTQVLLSTGQTVVELAEGTSVIVDGLGGTLGDAVSVDLAQGQVIGGPQSLLGQNLTKVAGTATSLPGISTARSLATGTTSSNGAAGRLLRSNAGQLLGIRRTTATVTNTVTNVTNTLNGTLSGSCC